MLAALETCLRDLGVSVNPGARQWAVNLIGFDGLRSFGSPSYYAQKMFAQDLGDVIVPTDVSGLSPLYTCATRDTRTGTVYVKAVNMTDTDLQTMVVMKGARNVGARATVTTLTGKLTEMNTVDAPARVAPVTSSFRPSGSSFTYKFPARSVTVIALPSR